MRKRNKKMILLINKYIKYQDEKDLIQIYKELGIEDVYKEYDLITKKESILSREKRDITLFFYDRMLELNKDVKNEKE